MGRRQRSFRNPPSANTELISRELAPPFRPPRRNGNERADASALLSSFHPLSFSSLLFPVALALYYGTRLASFRFLEQTRRSARISG